MTKLKEYEVTITEEAEADLRDIYDYIFAAFSRETADRIRRRLESEMLSLGKLPKRQRTFYRRFRRLLVGSSQMIYVVEDNEVIIKGIFHISMDIVSRLRER